MQPTSYAVNLAVTTDRHLTDEQARDVAAEWAADLRFDVGLTSTSRDDPWLRVSAACPDYYGAANLGQSAAAVLIDRLGRRGVAVEHWHVVEVLDGAEVARRASRPAIPPLVDAAAFAELCEVDRSRIYHLDKRRPDSFPAPVLEGHWLRAEAEHYARTRPRKPGPVPGRARRATESDDEIPAERIEVTVTPETGKRVGTGALGASCAECGHSAWAHGKQVTDPPEGVACHSAIFGEVRPDDDAVDECPCEGYRYPASAAEQAGSGS